MNRSMWGRGGRVSTGGLYCGPEPEKLENRSLDLPPRTVPGGSRKPDHLLGIRDGMGWRPAARRRCRFWSAGFAWALTLLVFYAGCAGPAEESRSEKQVVDLIVISGTVLVMDSDGSVYDPGFVAVSGDSIVAVGPEESGRRNFTAPKILNAAGKIVLPGLINGHQHAPMVLMRGLADDLELMEWLEDYIFPAEAQTVNSDFVYWGTMLAGMEMVSSGTTTYADMYYFEDQVARATAQIGMRGVLGQTVIGFPAPDSPTPEVTLRKTEKFIGDWKDHPLVIPAIAPHSPYTVTKEVLQASGQLAERLQVPLLIHVAETRREVEIMLERTGKRPVEYLAEIGLLSPRMVAAHAVWVEPHEMDLLAKAGVGLVHNPESNMKLASGVAPVPEMLRRGLKLGLGTDGAASNNNLDLFQEMDTAAKLHKLHSRDPEVVSARRVLQMATRGSAEALGLGEVLGSLEMGKKADLIIVGKSSPAAFPRYDPYSSLVYALNGSSVETVVIGGRLILENGRFSKLDTAIIYTEAERLRTAVIKAVSNR